MSAPRTIIDKIWDAHCVRAESAEAPAIAYCQGTPLRNEIEARDATSLARATQAATQALAADFGSGPARSRSSSVPPEASVAVDSRPW